MAQTSWPFEDIDTTETQFSLWARNLGQGVIKDRANELEVFGDSSGLNVKIKTGEALLRGHFYSSNAEETLTIQTANLVNPRVDLVILKLDPSENSILLSVLTGTPNAVPEPPALTQTDDGIYEIALASVYVGPGVAGIAPADVTDIRYIFTPWTGIVQGDQITGEIADATVVGSQITGSLTVATVPGSQISGSITTGTLPGANITGTVPAGIIATGSSSKSANYTIQATDENTYILSTGSAITITVPDVLSNGESVNFIQVGTGAITFAGSGVTINSADAKLKTAKQYAGATITKLAGAYYLIGNLG